MSFVLDDAEIGGLGWLQPESSIIARDNRAGNVAVTYPVPGTVTEQILSVSFKIVVAGTDGARIPTLSYLGPDGVAFAAVAAPFSVGNAITARYLFAVGINQFGGNDAANIGVALPPFKLGVGTSLSLGVTAGTAGDAISEVRIVVAKWPVRP